MINNVRIRARKKKLELDSVNIILDPKYFNTADNYSKGKYLLQ